jgi:hypothetical protein
LGGLSTNANKGLLRSPEPGDLPADLVHAPSKSFLSPKHGFFTPRQFVVDRRSEEALGLGVTPEFHRRLKSFIGIRT